MNLYFLVEGKHSEPKIYRSWLSFLLPEIQEVQGFQEATGNKYFMHGAKHNSPSFKERLRASILETNSTGSYTYLIICIDAEERTVEETTNGINELLNELIKENVKIAQQTQIEFIVQNRCIETWLLGNRRMFSRTPQNPDLVNYINHFSVYDDNPEEMERPIDDDRFSTHAQFHFEYLRALFAEKNIAYSKKFPRQAQEQHYIEQLQKRVYETNHLNSLKSLFDFLGKIRKLIQ